MLTSARYRSTQKPRTFRGPRGKFKVQVRKVFKTKRLLDLIIACLQESLGEFRPEIFVIQLGFTKDTIDGVKSVLWWKKAQWKAIFP